MLRLFLGLPVPEDVGEQLALIGGGIPGARWEPPEKLHLTLRFLGETDAGSKRRLEDALMRLEARAFEMALVGVGHFPPRGVPRSIWAGVEAGPELADLKRKVDRIADTRGFEPDRRKFAPHVTLARLKQPPRGRVADFEAHHGLLRTRTWTVDRVRLYSSVRAPSGSRYRVEAAFPLQGPD